MIICDDIDRPIPFVVESICVDLGRLKVSVDRRESETTPIYFKSRYLPHDDPERERQAPIEAAMTATGLFPPDAPEPEWQEARKALLGIVPDI